MAKKPSEVRTAEKKRWQDIHAIITGWESEVDAALDEQALPPGSLFQHDLVCVKGTDASTQEEAVRKLAARYKSAGWNDVRVGPCVNLHVNCEPSAHLTLGIPDLKAEAAAKEKAVKEAKKAEEVKEKAKTEVKEKAVKEAKKAEEVKKAKK